MKEITKADELERDKSYLVYDNGEYWGDARFHSSEELLEMEGMRLFEVPTLKDIEEQCNE